jgi:hypothetical protein
VAAHEQFEAFSSDATILPIPVEVTAGPYGYRTTGGMFGLSNIRDAVFQSHDPKPRRSGNITFTPVADFVGSASINYTINDENGFTSNPTDLTITVIPGTDTAADVITVNESADAQIVDLLTGVSDPFASIAAVSILGDDRGIELIGSQLHVEPAVYRDLNKGSISVIGVQFTVNRMSGSETRAIEIRITGDSESRLGDLDGDGVVSLADFAVLRWNYGSTKAGQEDGDLNGDAVVDFQDYVILKENLGHSV